MKSRNIILIALLAVLSVTASTQCMFINGLKTLIRGTGTAIGVGLPTVPWIILTGKNLYTVNEEILTTSRTPSPEEEVFLREIITDKNITVRINNTSGNSMGCCITNTIVIQENVDDMTIIDAIKLNTPEALNARKIFKGISEHELKHIQEKHDLKKVLLNTITPCAITGLTVASCKKIFPLNKQSSLLRHCLRFGAKVAGGSALMTAAAGTTAYIKRYANHNYEYEADQNISPENRNAIIEYNNKIAKLQQQHLDKIDDPTKKNILKMISEFSHPPFEERIKRLQDDTKNS